MIINNTNQFIFIHIPKCAGTSVRKILQQYDESNSYFTSRIDTHKRLGTVDFVHLPLFILKEHFNYEYNLILNYESYALTRDPHTRFTSSLAHHIKHHHASNSRPESNKTRYILDCVITNLMNNSPGEILPHSLIHFQRQTDYIFDNDRQIVKNVYKTEDIQLLIEDVIIKHNLPINTQELDLQQKANPSLVYKNFIYRFIANNTRPLLKKHLSNTSIEHIQRYSNRILYKKNDRLYKYISNSFYINEFINIYYKKDLEFYETLD